MFTQGETYTFTYIEVKPLIVRPQLSRPAIQKPPAKDPLETRRLQNISRLRRKQVRKLSRKKLKFKFDPEFLALTLMGSGLSIMLIKTATEYLFKLIY